MRKLVIIPTYNEKENISAMIDKVFSLPEPFEMLVIDDGSPDGTAAIVKERRKEFPERLHLMERAGKLGLGTAYLAGFRWGLENGFDYICEMDCDFSHNPDDLVRLYRAAADGAGEQTLRPHQHLAARAAGGRAVIPHDGGQHGVLLLFPLIEQGLEDVVHTLLLSRAIGIGSADPYSFIQPAAFTAGREFATSALYWSMVRSQW